MKRMSRAEAETKRQQAIALMERTGGDAEKFREMDAAEYAASKGAQILENPTVRRTPPMATSKTADLQADLDDAQETIDTINDLADDALDPSLTREEVIEKVKEIADLASGEGEDEDDDDSNQD